jgi:hypothetical protein
LDWYLNDLDHLDNIDSRDLAPNLSTYESTRFTKRYGVTGGTLTMQLTPETAWALNGGGWYVPETYEFKLVFTIPQQVQALQSMSARSSQPWWNLSVEAAVPEPSSYVMGGLGIAAMFAARRSRRFQRSA